MSQPEPSTPRVIAHETWVNMMEIWKQVDGEPYYEVSDLGRVRSVPRILSVPAGRWGQPLTKRCQGNVLRPWTVGAGYLCVALGGKRRAYIHRLVAGAFRPCPSEHHEVNHRNGDKRDNRAANLEWVTKRENAQHATHVLGKRAGQFLPKLSEVERTQVMALRAQGLLMREIAHLVGVNTTTIWRCLQ